MKRYRRPLIIFFVLYLLSIGPVFGYALSRDLYPEPTDHPLTKTLTVVYYPVDAIADALPVLGVPLRRYQVLWFRIFSR